MVLKRRRTASLKFREHDVHTKSFRNPKALTATAKPIDNILMYLSNSKIADAVQLPFLGIEKKLEASPCPGMVLSMFCSLDISL